MHIIHVNRIDVSLMNKYEIFLMLILEEFDLTEALAAFGQCQT
jgi:hypothetical protein